MLKQLSIKNFKSHKDTKLDFSPGVNVILGRSQAGKTNVLRSLLLLANNRPGGGKYFSDFAGQKGVTKVSLTLDDNSVVTLSKDIQINKTGDKVIKGTKYTIGEDSFEGFGTSVPDQIQEKLNLSELNIQKQFDMPFLVMASAGEIARTINRITKLEKVDEWISTLTTKINSDNQKGKILEEEIKESKKSLLKYKDLDKAERCVNNVVRLTQEMELLKTRKVKIEKAIELFNTITESITNIKQALKIEKTVDGVTGLSNRISRSIVLENKLIEVVDLEKWINSTKKVLDKIAPITKKVIQTTKDIISLQDVNFSVNEYLDANSTWLNVQCHYFEAKELYILELETVGKCPLCWNEIDETCIERIIEEL